MIALNRSAEVPARLKDLIEAVESQLADFKIQRSFAAVEHFIDGNPQFAADKAALFQLFAAFSGENRDAIVKRLRSAPFKN